MLRDLPANLPAAVVVAQHLGSQGSRLVEIMARRIALPVAWAEEGGELAAGRVTVCPPRSLLEVLPDGTCAVHELAGRVEERPLDMLLGSVADSFGPGRLGWC